MSHYIAATDYNALIADLLTANDAHDPRSRVIELLGDLADVWPASILSDPECTTPVEVECVNAFTGAIAMVMIDSVLAKTPKARKRVLAILDHGMHQLPESAVAMASAKLDHDIEQEDFTEANADPDAFLNEAQRQLDVLIASFPKAA